MLPPGWISYTRSVAVPLDVEVLTRPPLATRCPLRRPGVGVVLLSHCWLWGRGGVGDAVHAPPPCCLSWIPQGGCRSPLLAPMPMRHPPYAHRSHSYPLFRRTTSAFVVVHVSDSYPGLLPRPPSLCHLRVSPGLAHPSPRPSFIPWFHRGGTFPVLDDCVGRYRRCIQLLRINTNGDLEVYTQKMPRPDRNRKNNFFIAKIPHERAGRPRSSDAAPPTPASCGPHGWHDGRAFSTIVTLVARA